MRVHLETNGTIAPPLAVASGPDGRVFDWATVSPKPPDYAIARGWRGKVDELKFVVDDHLTAAVAEQTAADYPEAVVSIQPVAGTKAQRAVAMVMDHPEWRLSLQLHKILGIR